MDYKAYKIHHSRGKSDTDFYQDQNILNGAYSGLNVLRISFVSDLTNVSYSRKFKKSSKNLNINKMNSQNQEEKETDYEEKGDKKILNLIERILLFKQELDKYFFGNKIHFIKFHLNILSSIMIKNISDMQNELITAYPVLRTSNIVRFLGNFSDIISTFRDTKPQDFYREIKDTILNAWEKTQIHIKQLFDKIEKFCNVNIESEKEEFNFSIEHYELYNNIHNYEKEKEKIEICREDKEEEDIKKLLKNLPAALNYLLQKKKYIMNFVKYMTQGILFSISRLFYDMDYYSIIISSLAFKSFYSIMHYVDANKNTVDNLTKKEKKEKLKIFHLMNHFMYLTYFFNRNIKKGNLALFNGGLNSLSKFILNNFIEIISKCVILKIPSKVPKFKEPTLFQIKYKTCFYKCYPQRYKKYEDNTLLRIFMLYYNSKITFWKSILLVAKQKDNKNTITCRTCEKEIPIGDIFIHFGCCKDTQSFYDKMKLFKLKMEKCINNLNIYLAKTNLNNNSKKKRKIFSKGTQLYYLINKIQGYDYDDQGEKFIKDLIKLYNYEKNKPNNYYEKNPENLFFIVSLSYFSLIIFLMNKINEEFDQELSEIIGGIFCTFLQIFMNVNFLLYIKKSKTKNNMIKFRKNQINNYKYNSTKDIIGDCFKFPESHKYSESNEKILNDDLLKSDLDLNIKLKVEEYKMKLSLNNFFSFKNSWNKSKDDTNSNFKRKGKKNMTVRIGSKIKQNKKVSFSQNKQLNRIIKNIDTNKINKRENNKYINKSAGKINNNRKRAYSFQHSNFELKRNFSHEKLNIYNYRKIRKRNIHMTRRKSQGNDIVTSNQRLLLGLIMKNKINKETYIFENKSENMNNITCNSCISCSEDSKSIFNNSLNLIDDNNFNNNNLFNNDSIFLSRMDSDIHNINSENSRLDSIDKTRDDSQKYFLNSNNNSFQLEYKKEKNINSKMSLFGNSNEYKTNEIQNDKKSTLFKKVNKNNEIIDDDNKSSEFDDDSNSYEDRKDIGNNIFINCSDEEEENVEKTNIEENNESKLEFANGNENNNNQILPEIMNVSEKSNINYEQFANVFIELQNDMLDDTYCINKNHNFNKKSILKLKRSPSPSNIKSNNLQNNSDKLKVPIKKFKSLKNYKNDDITDYKPIDIITNESTKRITKFKLILPIAKGGYGVVGLYKNIKTNDMYAIKTVDIKSMKEKHLSNSLKTEQDILKQIDSQYLVNSYFIFKDKKNYYFVMEYLPGGDVYTLLSKNNLPKRTIQLIVAETILAVNYLHNIGIIHHDIKPENILITSKGHFKLSDFGLSKTLEEDVDSDSQINKNLKNFVEFNKLFVNLGNDENENKDAVGTLNYMAPELFTDKYPQGGGVDYWAIGVLIFDLFSFSLPFEAKTQEELRNNIINIKIDWNKLINEEVTNVYGNINSAVDLIKKFLKENPRERWGDKNLKEIKSHKFFEGFNWDDVENIKNQTIKDYVKQRINQNNNQIKQRMSKEKNNKDINKGKDEYKTEDGYPTIIEINLTESEEKYFFTERYDNLSKKNTELIKKKIEKEENFKENISDLMLIDLE